MLPPGLTSPNFCVKAVRDLSRQGGALQPAETHNSTSISLCQIPGSSVAAYFPDGYLLSQGAPWVQLRGNVFHQVSANLCQVTLLFSSSEVSASIPASLAATSPWHSPRHTETQFTLCRTRDGAAGLFSALPVPGVPAFPGSRGTILALFPLSDLALGLTRMSACIPCTGGTPELPGRQWHRLCPGHLHPPQLGAARSFSITQTQPTPALERVNPNSTHPRFGEGDPCGSFRGKGICRDSLMLHCWWGRGQHCTEGEGQIGDI